MAADGKSNPVVGRHIQVTRNGPYVVKGNIPLVAKTQIVSEYGEPLSWQKNADLQVEGNEYELCRCGQSSHYPFCDRTHEKVGFDGTETALTSLAEARQKIFPGGTHIVVSKDPYVCMDSGFCGMRNASLGQLIAGSADTKVRSLVMAMVERCPSGALSYRIEAGRPVNEPDLPMQVAVTTEITSDGPIAGPIWVTGGIPVLRADGAPFETRKRVTLCNCGHSKSKPLCDGTHRSMAERQARRQRAAKP